MMKLSSKPSPHSKITFSQFFHGGSQATSLSCWKPSRRDFEDPAAALEGDSESGLVTVCERVCRQPPEALHCFRIPSNTGSKSNSSACVLGRGAADGGRARSAKRLSSRCSDQGQPPLLLCCSIHYFSTSLPPRRGSRAGREAEQAGLTRRREPRKMGRVGAEDDTTTWDLGLGRILAEGGLCTAQWGLTPWRGGDFEEGTDSLRASVLWSLNWERQQWCPLLELEVSGGGGRCPCSLKTVSLGITKIL